MIVIRPLNSRRPHNQSQKTNSGMNAKRKTVNWAGREEKSETEKTCFP